MDHPSSAITDESLRAAILAAFQAESRIAGCSLHVGVLNGIAHLAGIVDSLAERALAEELAVGVPGLHGVVNRIEAPGAPSPARRIDLNCEGGSQ